MGQDYKVESFEIVPNDLTARTKGRVDNNGRKCGLIKVYVKDAITATDGPVIGEVIDRGMEKWVYVAHDAKQVELLFKEHMPLRVIFDDFNFTTLSGNMTYIMKLKEVGAADSKIIPTNPIREQSVLPSAQTSASASSNQMLSIKTKGRKNTLNLDNPTDEVDFVIRNLINNMVYVEGGTFMMGSEEKDAHDREKPVHQETVESFSIGKYEVTQKEWEVVMGKNPSYFKGDDLPVENITWKDCNKFIKKLNTLTGMNFRLPTEEEWEYAARGGNRSNGYKYSGSNEINKVAWYDENSGKKTHQVGTLSGNELGIYDMTGNVWEWTSSKWCNDYNEPRDSKFIVYRGYGWGDNAPNSRVTARNYCNRDSYSDNDIGFRLAL